jgi:hypothetical protein
MLLITGQGAVVVPGQNRRRSAMTREVRTLKVGELTDAELDAINGGSLFDAAVGGIAVAAVALSPTVAAAAIGGAVVAGAAYGAYRGVCSLL